MVEGRREKVFYAASGGEGWREKFTYRAKTMPAFTLQRSGATLVFLKDDVPASEAAPRRDALFSSSLLNGFFESALFEKLFYYYSLVLYNEW